MTGFERSVPAGKIFIGLTGTPASGKSTVAARFAKLGALVLCADTIAKAELEPGGAGWRYLKTSHPHLIGADGMVDRKKLADLVFENGQARRELEAAVHPAVTDKMFEAACAVPEKIVIFDVPLLFESGMKKDWFSAVITVSADEKTRLARALARGWSEHEFYRRCAAQLSGSKKNSLSDFVIDNTGSEKELYASVDGIYKALGENKSSK